MVLYTLHLLIYYSIILLSNSQLKYFSDFRAYRWTGFDVRAGVGSFGFGSQTGTGPEEHRK